jgi:hypothetical protein
MHSARKHPVRVAVLTGIMALMFGLAGSSNSVAAQGEASDCVEVLGVGAAGDACINVVHASPDAPDVDVYLDGALALEGLAFGTFSGWVAVPAGDYRVQVAPAGQGADAAVIDAEVTVEAGDAYHIAATAVVAEIAPAVFQADLGPLDSGTARVRVLHTSPDAPPIDVAVTGGDVLIENLSFPNASAFLEVPAGSYDLEVRPAGATDVVLPLPGVEFGAGMLYDVFAIGLLDDGSLGVLVVPSATASDVSGLPDTGAGTVPVKDGVSPAVAAALGALGLAACAWLVRRHHAPVAARAVSTRS